MSNLSRRFFWIQWYKSIKLSIDDGPLFHVWVVKQNYIRWRISSIILLYFPCDFHVITKLMHNQQKFPTIQIIRCVNENSPLNITATAGGITKIPTSQSATAKWWKNQPLIYVQLTQYIFWLIINKQLILILNGLDK